MDIPRPQSPKRPRRTYEEAELNKLEEVFAENPYPNRQYMIELAREMIDVSSKNVQIWFQNRRARERALKRKAEGTVENPIDRMRFQLNYQQQRPPLKLSNESNKENAFHQTQAEETEPAFGKHSDTPCTIDSGYIPNASTCAELGDNAGCNYNYVSEAAAPENSGSFCAPFDCAQDQTMCNNVVLNPERRRNRRLTVSVSNLSDISNSSFIDLLPDLTDNYTPSPNIYDAVFQF